MKAIVTGSSGFIGRHLVKELEKQSIPFHPLDNRVLFHANNTRSLLPYDTDTIFHLAAYGNMAKQKDDLYTIKEGNIDKTFNLLMATKDMDYKAFINISSSSVTLPHQTLYAATKSATEALGRAFRHEYNKPVISVRPYSVYGENEAAFRFIPTVFRSCLKGEAMTLDPDATHDWVYVGDFVTFLLHIAENPHLYTEIEGFGTGISTPNAHVVHLVEKITGKKAYIIETKQLRSFDTNKWKAGGKRQGLTSLEEGLRKYYQSIKS